MGNEVQYILDKYKIDRVSRHTMPLQIPNVGRDDLAKLFYELNYTIGVELGVQEGRYSETLCQSNPNLMLYCIDAWKAYKGYIDFTNKARLERFYNHALKRLYKYPCLVMRRFGKDAVKYFDDGSLDFIYIDANHAFEAVTEDIKMWYPKIRSGGIISGHDYLDQRPELQYGVVKAVNTMVKEYKIRPWFVLGRKEIIPGEIRDAARSWFWVKP
jgi:hypothetical protein